MALYMMNLLLIPNKQTNKQKRIGAADLFAADFVTVRAATTISNAMDSHQELNCNSFFVLLI